MNTADHPYALPVSTDHGLFVAQYSAAGLAGLNFPFEKPGSISSTAPDVVTSWHALTSKAVKAMLAGKAPKEMPPFVPAGTDFQQAVWRELRRIPLGQTRSYGEIAAAVNRPRGAQAVGQACGANVIPLLIPCHRVLAVGGKLGGFSGGLDWKRRLLTIEGVTLC